jgi:DNA-directed RNA polymerase subunit RPC12/RpoP
MSTRRRRVAETVRCPRCGEHRLVKPKLSPLADEERLAGHSATPWWAKSDGWSVGLARQNNLVWACDACAREGRAVPAKPWLQETAGSPPRFAYWDVPKICRSCGGDFVFSAAEQRRWYEEYKLPPNAEPVECRSCSSHRRLLATTNSELGAKLAALDPKNAQQLADIAALYVVLGSPRKAALYLRRAKNASRDPAQVAELLQRLASVEDRPA